MEALQAQRIDLGQAAHEEVHNDQGAVEGEGIGQQEGAVADQVEREHGVDDDEDNDHDDDYDDGESTLPDLMRIDDPLRMALTKEEMDWALAIKVAIIDSLELDNLSDFMIAQFALICKDNVADAVQRAESLQAFREEYGIAEYYGEGCRALQDMMELFPQTILHFGFSVSEGSYVLALDVPKFDSTLINTDRKLVQYLVGSYYLAHTAFPDLESIRKGMISMAECEGMDYTRRQDFKPIQKVFSELWSCYPLEGKFNHYHTGVLFNLMGTMLKKVLPPETRKKFQFGMMCDGRLDAICLVPNPEAATQRVLSQMKNTLQLRFENERKFSLDD